jgi:hypothetical protein
MVMGSQNNVFNEISFSCFKYCPKSLVIDNKSQHNDVEKKRANESERERMKERTTINYTKTRRKKEHQCHHSVLIILNYDNLT